MIPSQSLSRILFGVLLTAYTLTSTLASALTVQPSTLDYHPQAPKHALLLDVPAGSVEKLKIELFDPNKKEPFTFKSGSVVFKPTVLRTLSQSAGAGPATMDLWVDFSSWTQPGQYELRVSGLTDSGGLPLMGAKEFVSAPLAVSEFLYWDALKPVMRSFYFHHAATDIDDPITKVYTPAGHVQDATTASGAFVNVGGGWYLGNDYGKYTTPTSLMASRLMSLYLQDAKPYKYLRLDYPLSERRTSQLPDLLHETKVGLSWLLSMQRLDGAFYRKVAGHEWPGPQTLPADDTQPRYLYNPTPQDTAAAAASLAMAARAYKEKDLGFAVKSLMAGEKAWAWLAAQPATSKPADYDTAGSQEFLVLESTQKDLPYRVWAAAELYLATSKDVYHRYFLDHYAQVPIAPVSWKNPALLGFMQYLTTPGRGQDPQAMQTLRSGILNMAQTLQTRMAMQPSGMGLLTYGADSNGEALENIIVLLDAYALSSEPTTLAVAADALNSLFGLNPMGKTFLTGLGGEKTMANAVQHPCHRLSRGTGIVIPGLLVYGPNAMATDGKTPRGLGVMSYADAHTACDTNGIDLMNTARLAYALGTLNHFYNATAPLQGEEGPATPLDEIKKLLPQ